MHVNGGSSLVVFMILLDKFFVLLCHHIHQFFFLAYLSVHHFQSLPQVLELNGVALYRRFLGGTDSSPFFDCALNYGGLLLKRDGFP